MISIGIDLGGTTIGGALLEADTGRLLTFRSVQTVAQDGPAAVTARILQLARALVETSEKRAGCVGIGVPGLYDTQTHCTRFLPNLPTQWRNVPLGPEVQAALELPTVLINDVRAFVLAEARLGAGQGADRVVGMTLGTGVGGGVVIGGRLLFGHEGTAGEVGHQIIEMHGDPCGCGGRGCLEAYATGPAIAARGMRAVRQGLSTSLRALADDDLNNITPELVARAARGGDAVARRILADVALYVGIGAANLVTLFSPDVLIIGGGVAKTGGHWLYPVVRRTIRQRCHVTPVERVRVARPALGEPAGAIGAAIWAADRARQGRPCKQGEPE